MFQDNSLLQPLHVGTAGQAGLQWFIGLLHAVTLALLPLTSLSFVMAGSMAVVVLLHGSIQLYRYRPQRPQAVCEIRLDSPAGTAAQWWLRLASGHWLPARLGSDALIHPRLLLLRFHSERGSHRVLLRANADNAEVLRRLRVRLRHPAVGDQ